MGNEVVAFNEVEKMATAVAKSGLFGMSTPEQALSLMLLAQAEGIHPMTAARDYHIIKGRPSLKADAILARFQNAGGVIKWVARTDQKVSAYFSHPSCPDPILIDWDIARAKQAMLGGNGMWEKYPRQMLTARVISEGVRATYPGACSGVYTPEEVQDFEPHAVKPAQLPQDAPQATKSEITDAEVVISGKQPLSGKTIAKFNMAKGALNGEFDAILKSHNLISINDIKDEEQAAIIFAEMKQAFEARKAVAK